MTTSGLEPIFSGFYTRRVKINPGQEGKRVDFIDKNGDHWMEMPVLHPKFEDWISLTYNISREDIQTFSSKILEDYFYKSPWFGSTANDIDWVKRVEIQAIIQKYISHSISSTINLPNSVTKAEVAEIYTQAWKQGLKGVTVYRDGCRSGVLISNESKEDSFKYVDAAKRPKELECEIFTTTSAGKKYNVIVGLMEGKPYEVFLTNFFTKETKSTLSKASRGAYNLVKDGEILYENFTTEMSEEEEAITRMISTSLRHRTNIKFIVEQLNKIPSENMFSFVKSLVRVLKKYIPDGEKSTLICDDCGGSNVIFEEGCNKCQDCGDSKC
jgi:ribonucleoside-diphosphate reductase alpha chain